MLQDLRFALRLLIKDPWFTTLAAVALALGIGVNNTVFTFVNAVLLRGLPFRDSHEIMLVASRDANLEEMGVSYADFEDWRRQSASFRGLAVFDQGVMNVSDATHPPEQITGGLVSANAFSVIGQLPILGRDFQPADDRPGAPRVVILGYSVWKNRYGGDPSLVGRTIRVNDVPSEVVGVMPEGFRFPVNADMWQPYIPEGDATKRDQRNLLAFGRVAPGVSMKQAQVEMSGIAKRLEQQYPDTNKGIDAKVMTFNDRFNGGPIRVVFLVLLGAVGFVLLIACANVANLLMSRSAKRAREIALRIALGASRTRVVRQLLVESTILAFIGGLLGLGLSLVGVRLFDIAVADVGKPYWIQFTMDATVFAYLAAVCLATGIIFGLAPALQVSKTNLNEILKEAGRGNAGGRRARRLTAAMVVVELALTLVLLAGAGLMMRSFFKLYSLDVGVETSHLLTMRTTLPERKYKTTEQRKAFYDALLPRLQAIPGLHGAALATSVPLNGGQTRGLEIDGRPAPDAARLPQVSTLFVSANYFDTLGMPLREGRALRETDGEAGAEVIVVNARFAAQFFPGESAVGKRVRLREILPAGRTQAAAPPTLPPWVTIVGVVPTVRQRNVEQIDADAVSYLPYRMRPTQSMSVIARTAGDPASVIPAFRQAVQSVDPDQPVYDVRTMDEVLARSRWPFRVFGSLFTIFAIIALVLSSVGIYAVTAYAVSERTQEIGVRMALGAQQSQVSWLILRQGLVQLAFGLAIGLGAAFVVSRALASLLVQTTTYDPLTFTTITALLTVITVVACLVPARRATRLDPVVALRE
ncbi:MAG TPA: ABC transporter permease [Vicinamibacterales bacterium]